MSVPKVKLLYYNQRDKSILYFRFLSSTNIEENLLTKRRKNLFHVADMQGGSKRKSAPPPFSWKMYYHTVTEKMLSQSK